MKMILIITLISLNTITVNAQRDTTKRKFYTVRPKYDLPGALAAVFLSTQGFHKLDQRASLSAEDVAKLNVNDINSFDRPTVFRDPKYFNSSELSANRLLNFSLVSPVFLALDNKIRKDWLDILSMYFVTQAFDNLVYFGTIVSVRRPRPKAYITELPVGERTGNGMSKSFFSGHTCFSATATFFAASVFADYHHLKGWERIACYSVAAIPPALVGFYRVRAGEHFKTDVMTGFTAGALSGIAVPAFYKHWHRNAKNKVKVSAFYVPQGAVATMNFALN